MANPTKIVVHYDNGTQVEIAAAGVGSVFMSQDAAVRCGHRPPYNSPPGGGTMSATAMSTSETKCYLINGIIVCP